MGIRNAPVEICVTMHRRRGPRLHSGYVAFEARGATRGSLAVSTRLRPAFWLGTVLCRRPGSPVPLPESLPSVPATPMLTVTESPLTADSAGRLGGLRAFREAMSFLSSSLRPAPRGALRRSGVPRTRKLEFSISVERIQMRNRPLYVFLETKSRTLRRPRETSARLQ